MDNVSNCQTLWFFFSSHILTFLLLRTNKHLRNSQVKLFLQKKQDSRAATLLIADSAYDDKKTYDKAIGLGLVPLIAYNPKKAKIKSFYKLKPSNWRKRAIGAEGIQLRKKFYHLRGTVERYQSTIKELLNGRSVPVRGLSKVRNYLYGLTILTQLYGLINWFLTHSIRIPRQLSLDLFL